MRRPRPHHTRDFLLQGSRARAGRIAIVEVIERRRAARQRLRRGKARFMRGIVHAEQQVGLGQVLQMHEGIGTRHAQPQAIGVFGGFGRVPRQIERVA